MWTRIFEVDTDEVLDFKQAVLRDIGAIVDLPTERIPLPVDVTQDLTDPLVAAGFSPSAPSAWVAEGLLLYLTAEQNDSLLTSVSGLAVADSPLLLTLTPAGQHARDEATASQGCGVHNPFRVSDGPDDPVGWLTEFGWRLTVASGVPGQ
jgi:methyltransferase (TIGR00027 family)